MFCFWLQMSFSLTLCWRSKVCKCWLWAFIYLVFFSQAYNHTKSKKGSAVLLLFQSYFMLLRFFWWILLMFTVSETLWDCPSTNTKPQITCEVFETTERSRLKIVFFMQKQLLPSIMCPSQQPLNYYSYFKWNLTINHISQTEVCLQSAPPPLRTYIAPSRYPILTYWEEPLGHDVDVTLTCITYLEMESVITVESVDRIRCPKAEGIWFRNCQTGLPILQTAFFYWILYFDSSVLPWTWTKTWTLGA